nr:immunoglobulin heavy chain junction region [Mus musculus]
CARSGGNFFFDYW